jgi:hypothetical protein
VVQFVYPHIFNKYVNKYFIKKLIKQNKSAFLLAAGSDYYYWQNYSKKFKYSPHYDHLKIDLKTTFNGMDKWLVDWNKEIVGLVNSVIPVAYDYRIGYDQFKNVSKTIPMPFDLNSIIPKFYDIKKNKVIIMHGISRPGFKGSKYIIEAIYKIKKKYKSRVEIIMPEKLPLDEYLLVMEKVDIVIDQALSYSYGMNALISASMGKVTLSGAEPECLMEYNVDNCPIINITKFKNDIYLKLDRLISDRQLLLKYSLESRDYVDKVHNCNLIASKYINTWLIN